MFAFNPRDMKRLMRQFGIRMEEVRAERVVIDLEDGKRLIIDRPVSVLKMEQRGQPPTFFVIGEARVAEPEEAGEGAVEISDEDVMLVAEQAGVSPEEARRALEEAGGDIAEAILRLQEGKQ